MNKSRYIKLLVILLLLMPAFTPPASGTETQRCPDSLPPPPKPHQRAGGESLPPLPLPVTPLRRTEKKKPPSPPVLIAKAVYGNRDWLINRNDANNLLRWFEAEAGFKFRSQMTRSQQLTSDIPILYVSGWSPFTLNASRRSKLRNYLVNGGFLVMSACCRSDGFKKTAIQEITKLFPERKLQTIDIDHPIYRSLYDITGHEYTKMAVEKGMLKEVTIGWRTVLLYSEFDLGRGWISKKHLNNCPAYETDNKDWAKKFGMNMISYVLATRKMGKAQPDSVVYSDDEDRASSFTIAQVVHSGKWDPDPSAISVLLKALNETTGMAVNFQTRSIELTSQKLFSHPFLYMTGYGNFNLSDDEVKHLRFYLLNGGFLFTDSASGREIFDMAFRREIKKVLPEFKLSPIPLDHPIYQTVYEIADVDYSTALKVTGAGSAKPRLEGISIDGNLAVVHSRDDLRYGWGFTDHPYRKGYSPSDSLRLGINTVVYALTH